MLCGVKWPMLITVYNCQFVVTNLSLYLHVSVPAISCTATISATVMLLQLWPK